MGWPRGHTSLDATVSHELMLYHEQKIRPGKKMHGVQLGYEKEAIQRTPGGQERVFSSEVLQPTLHGRSNDEGRSDDCCTTRKGGKVEGGRVSRVRLGSLGVNSSCGSGPEKQLTVKPDDAVRKLSHEMALEEWEAYAEEAVGLQNMWVACSEAGYVSKALPTLQEVWKSLDDQEKDWVIVRCCSGSSWIAEWPNVGRVAKGVQDRVARLKAIGNGQVPACAALAWRLLGGPVVT